MSRTPAWLWPNLLSLDAPLVALVWQDLAARSFHTPLLPTARVVLGLTVWAVYLADRLLDIRSTHPAVNTPRHNFFRRHVRPLAVLLTVVLMLDTFLATVELRRTVFIRGLAVAGCVGAYLSTFPLRASGWEKQVFAAILFATGVLLVTGTSLGVLPLLVPALLFAALCLCNLVLIELWEGFRERHLLWLAPAAIAGLSLFHLTTAWYDALALSGALLAALALFGARLSLDARRVLADVALLTPLLFR